MNAMGCLEHKGYLGSVEIDTEARCFHGKIEFIEDLVTFEANTYASLEREFKAAVNDYLATCQEACREPDRPFKGTFNVRVGAEMHKCAAIAARKDGKSLNEFVREAVALRLADEQRVVKHKHEHSLQVTHRVEAVQYQTTIPMFGAMQWKAIAQNN